MLILFRKRLILESVAIRWKQIHFDHPFTSMKPGWSSSLAEKIYMELSALDPKNSTQEQVNEITGDWRFTSNACTHCLRDCDETVRIHDVSSGRWVNVCRPCVVTMFNMFGCQPSDTFTVNKPTQ